MGGGRLITLIINNKEILSCDEICNLLDDFHIHNNCDLISCFLKIKNFDKELYRHSVNVAFLSVLIGTKLIENETQLSELFISSLLHDFGKMYIPKNILSKPSKLCNSEKRIMNLHSLFGYIFLKHNTAFSDDILLGILDHHEKYDGSGYAFGRKSCDISYYAKIIAPVDVFDAMISDRVYRKKLPLEYVIEYLQLNSQNCFDSKIVKILLELIGYYSDALDMMEINFEKNLNSIINN